MHLRLMTRNQWNLNTHMSIHELLYGCQALLSIDADLGDITILILALRENNWGDVEIAEQRVD